MSRLSKLLLAGIGLAAVVVVILVLISVADGGGGASAVTQPSGTANAATPSGGFSPAEIYQNTADGVVLVLSDFGSSGNQGLPAGHPSTQALGTGFVVKNDGTIITNAHVVQQNGQQAQGVQVAFRESGDKSSNRVDAKVVGVDATTDIAILKVDPGSRTLKTLPLGDSSKVTIGQWVVAIGNPLGFDFSITQGIVSGIGRNLQAPNNALIPNGIQTDAAINQGNSGGPLLDADGNVIGVNEQIASPSGSFSGLGFAIPINTAKTVMDQILTTGTVQHAYLGIQGLTIDGTLAQLLNLPVDHGVLVQQVQNGTAAADAGIQGGNQTTTVQGSQIRTGGDIITKLDGKDLSGMEDLASTIAKKKPGDKITLTILRNGKTQDVSVTLGQRPQS